MFFAFQVGIAVVFCHAVGRKDHRVLFLPSVSTIAEALLVQTPMGDSVYPHSDIIGHEAIWLSSRCGCTED